jgi:hypothetical protein
MHSGQSVLTSRLMEDQPCPFNDIPYRVFNLRYVKTSYMNQTITQEPLEPATSSDPHTHEDSSPNWGAAMPETSRIILVTGQNHINNL